MGIEGSNLSLPSEPSSSHCLVDGRVPSNDNSTAPYASQARQSVYVGNSSLDSSLTGEFLALRFDPSQTQLEETPNDHSNVIYLKLSRIPERPGDKAVTQGNKTLIFLLVVSWILLIGLVALQIIGFAFSVTRFLDAETKPQKTWCSPAFQLAVNPNDTIGNLSPARPLVFDGSCDNNHTVTIYPQGIGCIGIDGDQSAWLRATVIVVALQIVLEIVDVFLLVRFQNPTTWFHRRPVCTMVSGVAVWVGLTIIAGVQTKNYPLISGVVAIIAPAQPDCRLQLNSAGLRGEIIAWSDGVFGALNTAYFGPFGMDELRS